MIRNAPRLVCAFAALTLAAMTLAACDTGPEAMKRAAAARDAMPPVPPCESQELSLGAGQPAVQVCVIVGRLHAIRAAGEKPVMATVCNLSQEDKVYVAWSADPAARAATFGAERIWTESKGARRLKISARSCSDLFGPVTAVVMRGWQDGGQGYDIGVPWEGEIRFLPVR